MSWRYCRTGCGAHRSDSVTHADGCDVFRCLTCGDPGYTDPWPSDDDATARRRHAVAVARSRVSRFDLHTDWEDLGEDDRRLWRERARVAWEASLTDPSLADTDDLLEQAAERAPLVLPEPIANAACQRMDYLMVMHHRDPNLLDHEGRPSYRAEAEGIAHAVLTMERPGD